MPRLHRSLLHAVLLCALALALPGATRATSPPENQSDTATLGRVTAHFIYHEAGNGTWDQLWISIVRDGRLAYDAAPKAKGCEPPYCAPGAMGDAPSLRLADLDADGEPEVVVDLYTGGAHCCTVAEILRFNGSGYVSTSRSFGDPGYALEPGATPSDPMIFVTGDHRFAYAFASFADSRFPVRLLTFAGGRWRDVTRRHPATVRADAADLMAEYRRIRGTRRALGVLAAWVADQWNLSRRAEAYRFLTRELHAGRLKGDRPWPKRLGYIASLTRHLTIWGYRYPRTGDAP